MFIGRTYASFTKLLTAAIALPAIFAAACSSTTSNPPGTTGTGATGATGDTGGSGGSGGGGDGGGGSPPAVTLTVERWGTRIWGPILGLSRTDRTLWFGTRPVPDPDGAPTVHGGLGRLDIDTGEVKVFEAELPVVQQDFGEGPVDSPVATAGVIADGTRRLVVARTGILVIGDDGSVTEKPIATPGGDASPTNIVVDRGGGRARLWAATDMGLVRMNPDTFAVEEVLGVTELGSTNIGSLALDPNSGAVYLGVYGDAGDSHVARIDGDEVKTLAPGDSGTPSGLVGSIAWSTTADAAVFAIGGWDGKAGGVATWNGTDATVLATDAQLGEAARGSKDVFGAWHVAVADTDGLVIVGGSIRPTPPFGYLAGGGLAWIDLATKHVTGMSTTTSFIQGDDIGALTYDPETRRTYVSARQPCNENQLGNVGLVAISFRDDGTARFERPVLSGVRSMAVVGDDVYLGLRDDSPGLSCFGYVVQTGLVRLEGNRAGEIVPLQTGDDGILPFAGPTALAAQDAEHFAVGSFRDGTFIGDPTNGYAFNQASMPGVSLYETDVAWASADTLWIAGGAVHDPIDPPGLADKGPRGAAMVKLGTDGKPASFTHYVLASEDTKDVTGLPSSEIAGIVVAPGNGAFLACATERVGGYVTDRTIGDPFMLNGKARKGGVAQIDKDGKLVVIANDAVAPDPRGIALDPAGDLWVLDAEKGLLHYQGGAFVSAELPAGTPAGAYPHALWHGSMNDLAALYDKGALVSLGGKSTFVADVGHAWRAASRAPGVLMIGSDQGLIRARTTTDVAEKATTKGALPAFKN